MSNTYRAINGSLTANENCLEIKQKNKSTQIPYDKIQDVEIVELLLLGILIFTVKTSCNNQHTLLVKSKHRKQYDALQLLLHQHAKIHVYQEKTCRSLIVRTASLYDYLPLIVTAPFCCGSAGGCCTSAFHTYWHIYIAPPHYL